MARFSFAVVAFLGVACVSFHKPEPAAMGGAAKLASTRSGAPFVPRTGAFPSAACREKARELVLRMTLHEKVGQMTQASRETIQPGDIREFALGSILSGGGSAPGGGTPAEWADMLDAMHAEALGTRLAIPLVYGSDAVHGHGNVVGATIFPHNIGLGAARDPELVRALARATAVEMLATGVDWTFAPAVAAARDERWGRTYESFSEVPEEAGLLGGAAVRGYQGDRLGGDPSSVLACAKHYAGDGTTVFRSAKGALLDQGDTRLSSQDFARLALRPYDESLAAGVGSVMVSFSSLNGEKLHGHRPLVTDTLKGKLGFRGFVVTDWQGRDQLPGSVSEQIEKSVNAGVDMFMEPYAWKTFIATLKQSVEKGRVPMTRIDDAVTRIVTVKCEAGLFERGPVDRSSLARVGSREHLELARRAVAKTLVLLKNDGGLLPLRKAARLEISGSGARSLTRQAGGWTVGWQGAEDKPFLGTTLFEALRAAAAEPGLVVSNPSGAAVLGAVKPDVAVLVMSEPPYAEGKGDSETIAPPPEDVKALDALAARGVPTVVVVFSGRPLVIEPHLTKAKAWVAAWLPGSAGEGVADVLYGDVPPTAKLSHSWPRRVEDLPLNVGDARYEPLFPFKHGLTYAR
ncbi:MAG TPA: glycoside hydrolase family 3 N-terminal domain-containing protein [Polyangiaceae bacterium]